MRYSGYGGFRGQEWLCHIHVGGFTYTTPLSQLVGWPETPQKATHTRGGWHSSYLHAFHPITACFVRCFGCLRLQAAPMGSCSRVKGTGRSIALGVRPLTSHLSVWARGGANSPRLGVKNRLDGELEELELMGIHSSYDLMTSELKFICFLTCNWAIPTARNP
jgi:hypothetical protein